MALIRFKRATRSELNSEASGGNLIAAEPYYITDEGKFALGTSATTYTEYTTADEAVAAIKSDPDWNAGDWDIAFSWGDHGSAGYAVIGTGSGEVRANADLDARYGRLGSSNQWTGKNVFDADSLSIRNTGTFGASTKLSTGAIFASQTVTFPPSSGIVLLDSTIESQNWDWTGSHTIAGNLDVDGRTDLGHTYIDGQLRVGDQATVSNTLTIYYNSWNNHIRLSRGGTGGTDWIITSTGDHWIASGNQGGIRVGLATGGYKGGGTINATAVYDDNTLLTDYVFDKLLGGESFEYSEDIRAKYEALDPSLFDPGAYASFWKLHRRLPGMPDLNDTIEGKVKLPHGDLIHRLIETCELQAIHIEELRQRIEKMERNT